MKPVKIVGAGLAGLSLANALQRVGVSVTLFESGRLPRHRVCGEFICGKGKDALETLELESFLDCARLHTLTAWFINGKNVLERPLPHPAHGLSRWKLDQDLLKNFESLGGEVYLNQRHSLQAEAGTVFCHGRKPSPESRWIGLKFHYTELSTVADLELHLGARGYIGLSRVEGDRVNVCALFRRLKIPREKRSKLLDSYLKATGLDYVASRLRNAKCCEDSFAAVAGVNFSQIPIENKTDITLGDAYSVIPPFTGNGMSLALESAAIAFPILFDYARSRKSWAAACTDLNNQLHRTFDKRLQYARWLHPWLFDSWGQRCLKTAAKIKLLPFNTLYQLTH